jgi:hypothetical protein
MHHDGIQGEAEMDHGARGHDEPTPTSPAPLKSMSELAGRRRVP